MKKSNNKQIKKSTKEEEWKKNEIYVRGEESDYIEEEEEAKRIQESHLKRMINQGLINEISNTYKDESDEEKEDEKDKLDRILYESDEEENRKSYKIPDSTKKILINYANENEDVMKELKEIDSIVKEIYRYKERLNEKSISINSILEYINNKKKLLVSLSSCICYYILYRCQNMINDYHPVIKRIMSLELLVKKLKDDKLIRQVKDFIEKVKKDSNDTDKKAEVEMNKKIKESRLDNDNIMLSKKRKELKEIVTYKGKDKESKDKNDKQGKDSYKIKEEKNRLGIEKANKELAKGRGLYRKRKLKQGNSKLMNKIKYEKKSKIRKRYVKEFTEAPINYTGQYTGVRRDLVRSVKFKY